MKYRDVLNEVQPHYAWLIPIAAALIGAASSASSASSQRRSNAASNLAGVQGAAAGSQPFQPTASTAGERVLPNLPQGTSLRDAMGYDETRRSGGVGATDPAAFQYTEAGQPPPAAAPQVAPALAAAGAQPQQQPAAPQSQGLSTDQYVQLGQLGLQAGQALRGNRGPSPIPAGVPNQFQPTAYQAMRRRF